MSKVDFTSWIILHFEAHILESVIEKIRKDHFNQVAYLETVVKELKHAQKNGMPSPDLLSLLAPVATSIRQIQKKKNLKKTTES